MKRVAGLAVLGLAGTAVALIVTDGWQRSGAVDGPAEIALEDLRFTPNRLDAEVGVPLVVRLTNRGLERHDLNFPSLHMPALEGVESILVPGERRTITLVFDRPGTHTFLCTLPGHAAAGMTGAVYVRP